MHLDLQSILSWQWHAPKPVERCHRFGIDPRKARLASTMRISRSAFRPMHRSLLFDRRGRHLVLGGALCYLWNAHLPRAGAGPILLANKSGARLAVKIYRPRAGADLRFVLQ